jgi:hypothetical protein
MYLHTEYAVYSKSPSAYVPFPAYIKRDSNSNCLQILLDILYQFVILTSFSTYVCILRKYRP